MPFLRHNLLAILIFLQLLSSVAAEPIAKSDLDLTEIDSISFESPQDEIARLQQEILFSPISETEVQAETEAELPNEAVIDIVADEVHYTQEKVIYEASGNAQTYLIGKNAKLFADYISYNSETQLLEAFGNIRIVQAPSNIDISKLDVDNVIPVGANVIYGTYASFNTTTNYYNLNEPRLYANGIKLKAREASSTYIETPPGKRSKNVITLKNGVAILDHPIVVYSQGNSPHTHYSLEQKQYNTNRKVTWDQASRASVKYTAKEVYFDNTHKLNNLRIKGARLWLNDHLSVPSPVEITTTVGEASNSRFIGPIIGTQERVGGFALGPRFFYEADKGVFSFAPIIQIGNGPGFGGGAIVGFNTPNDKTALMVGYGSLYNRVIANLHQEIFGKHLQADALVNQFRKTSVFGTSQVGQLYELSSDYKLRFPFIDDRGMRIRAAAGWAKDNNDLFSNKNREQLADEKGGANALNKEHSGFRSELETSFYTKPIFRAGTEFYNISLRARGLGALRFYDTGDFMTIGRAGPSIETRLNNLSFELAYLFAVVGGESPFLFDQFVDGSSAIAFDGDYRVNKWFNIGAFLNYNLGREEFTSEEFRTEFGPQDFKIRFSYDVIRNQIALGFNMIFGQPVHYDSLRMRI